MSNEKKIFITPRISSFNDDNHTNSAKEIREITASIVRDLMHDSMRTFFPIKYVKDSILSFFWHKKVTNLHALIEKIKENEVENPYRRMLTLDVYSMKDNVLMLRHHFTSECHANTKTVPKPFGEFDAVMEKYYPNTNQENVHTLFFNLNGNVCWSSNRENIWIWSRLHHSNACRNAKDSHTNVEAYQLVAQITCDCVVLCVGMASLYDTLSIEAVESSVSFWKRRSIVKLVSKKTSSIVLVEDFNNAWDDWFDLDEYVDWARVLGNLIADRLNVKWIDRTV